MLILLSQRVVSSLTKYFECVSNDFRNRQKSIGKSGHTPLFFVIVFKGERGFCFYISHISTQQNMQYNLGLTEIITIWSGVLR